MKLTLEEIEQAIAEIANAMERAKEARRVAKKVYGDEREISIQLKYTYEHIQRAVKILEMRGE